MDTDFFPCPLKQETAVKTPPLLSATSKCRKIVLTLWISTLGLKIEIWSVCVTRRTVNYIRKIRHETLTLNLCVKDCDSSQNDDTGTMTNTHLLGLWKYFSCFVCIPWDAGVVCGHPPVVFFCSQSQPPSFSSPKKRQNIKLLKEIKLLT